MAPKLIGRAAQDTEVTNVWKGVEGLLNERIIRVDELADGDDGAIKHDPRFLAFMASNYPTLITTTIVTPRLRLTHNRVHKDIRTKFYKAVGATTFEAKLGAVTQLRTDLDTYVVAKKRLALPALGMAFQWYVCPQCPDEKWPALDVKGSLAKIRCKVL